MGKKVRTTQRGITMADPLIRLTVIGHKTETRRIQGLDSINLAPDRYKFVDIQHNMFNFERADAFKIIPCPFGHVGDYLYIKEAFMEIQAGEFIVRSASPMGNYKWRPGRFMPKAAAQTWLQITDIRVQRLADISDAECYDEGVRVLGDFQGCDIYGFDNYSDSATGINAKVPFMLLFEKIYGPLITDQNPWVWVIRYQVVEKPVLT